jgi:dTMP kinase
MTRNVVLDTDFGPLSDLNDATARPAPSAQQTRPAPSDWQAARTARPALGTQQARPAPDAQQTTNTAEQTPPAPNNRRGVFISFEGGEGVGKSTQILLLAARLKAAGIETCCLREPGGTPIGEAIRHILLDPAHTELDDMSELLLYEAARAQLVSRVIEPTLARGVTVLCDRFIDSTLAYQGVARGLGFELVEQANRLGSKGLLPQRTVILIHDPKEALDRATEEGADRLEAEGLAFHARVLEGYRQVAASNPERIRLVQSCERKEDTAEAVFSVLADLFPQAIACDFVIDDELIDWVRREHS